MCMCVCVCVCVNGKCPGNVTDENLHHLLAPYGKKKIKKEKKKDNNKEDQKSDK